MATRTVRRYRQRRPSSSSAPLSLQVLPGNTLAAQAAEWNTALSLANARAGLEKLAAGHTKWFVEEFGPSMLQQADTPDEKAYWQSLIDATHEHIVDDALAAEVKAGTKKYEDIAAHIHERMAQAGRDSAEYPALLESLNQVTDAIAARDFNNEIYAAQEKLAKDGDRASYLATLTGLQSRARDPMASQALTSQIAELQKEIDDQKSKMRMAEVDAKVIGYLKGDIGRGQVIEWLQSEAASGKYDQAQTAYMVNVAQEIDTRERTLERQGAADAAGVSTKALQSAIDKPKHSYEMADAQFTAAFRDGAADKEAYDALQKESKQYQDALRDALPNAANRTIREQILNAQESVTANLGERRKQMAELIKSDVTSEVDDLNSKAQRAEAKNTPEGDDLASQMRFLATNLVQGALADPLIAAMGDSNPSKLALQKSLRETTEAHQSAIESQAGVVAGKSGAAPLRTANRAAFNSYEDYMTKHGTTGVDKGVPLDYNSFLDALDQYGSDPQKLAAALGITPTPAQGDQKSKDAAAKATQDITNLVSSWQTNIGQAERTQKEISDAAALRLRELVAPRSQATGRKVSDTGPITEPTNVSDYLGQYGKPPMLYAPNAASVAPQEQSTYAGAGLIGPAPAPVTQKPPGLSSMTPAADESTANEDPYNRAERLAWEYLSTPSYTLDLSSWDVPPLPEAPAIDRLDLGAPDISGAPLLDTHERTLRALSPSPAMTGGSLGAAPGSSPTLAA